MLNMAKCSIIQTLALPVSASILAIEEGQALVYAFENGEQTVKPSTGAAGEFFAGVSFSRATTPTTVPIVEEITVPTAAPFTVTLAKTPLANPAAYIQAVGASPRVVLASAVAADATHYSLAGDVMTFDASFSGRTVQVVYRYTISHVEAVYKFNFDAFATVDLVSASVIGVVKDGIIVTDQYDSTADWATWNGATPITLGANGQFTIGGVGTAIANAAVMAVPSVNDGFLTIHLAAN